MSLPRGRSLPVSPWRRQMCDFLHFSRQVPLVAIERRFSLAPLVAARQAWVQRPSWFAIFTKAFAQVGARQESLRQSVLTFPWLRFHQHAVNVASLAVARPIDGEDAVVFLQIRQPELRPLADLDERLRRARSAPIEAIADFRRQRLLGRLPAPLRRLAWWSALHVVPSWRARYAGTFGVTSVGALGAELVQVLSPLTTTLSFGSFAADGGITLRLTYDHRLLDGVEPAVALEGLAEMLAGPILAELEQGGVADRRAA